MAAAHWRTMHIGGWARRLSEPRQKVIPVSTHAPANFACRQLVPVLRQQPTHPHHHVSRNSLVLAPPYLRQRLSQLVRVKFSPVSATATSTERCHISETNRCNSVVTGDRKKSGLIRKYGLNMSRQAFRENAADIGFVKVSASAWRDGEKTCADRLGL